MQEGDVVSCLSVSARRVKNDSTEDYNLWFLRHFPRVRMRHPAKIFVLIVRQISLRSSNRHCVWLSRHVKYRWKGLLKGEPEKCGHLA